MDISDATDVFFDQLKDLHSATSQAADTLPDLISWSEDGELTGALRHYENSVRSHLDELAALFEIHSQAVGDEICKAMSGLVEGGNDHIRKAANPWGRHVLLLAHSKRIALYLLAASECTLAIAARCPLPVETAGLRSVTTSHREFEAELARIGSANYQLEV